MKYMKIAWATALLFSGVAFAHADNNGKINTRTINNTTQKTTAAYSTVKATGEAKAAGNYVSKVWNPDKGDGTYVNPIINADYSDPDVIRVGEDFWLTASSFCNAPGLPLLHSTDLVNWEIAGYALPRLYPEDFYSRPQHGKGVWAPSIRHHDGEYFIYWGDPDFGVFMVKASDPRGEWSKPVLVWEGKGIIDSCPLWDEDGKAYLVNSWAKSRSGFNSALTVSELSADGSKVIGDPVLVYDGMPDGNHTVEGPKFYKRNGYYYILAPAGGVAPGWQIALRSRSPYGPYEAKTVMAQGKTDINGPHQGGWIDTGTGEDWFINFQDKGAIGRVTHLNPMRWVDDWPVIGIDKDGDGCGEPVSRYRKPVTLKKSVNKNPQESDSFDSTVLSPQWEWFANYDPTSFGYATPYGYFRLYGHRMSENFANIRETGNILTQKFPNDTFTATAKVTMSANGDRQQGGPVVMGRDYSRLAIESSGNNFIIKQITCIGADEGKPERAVTVATLPATRVNCEGPAKTTDIDLWTRITVDKKGMARFYYSTDGKKFHPSGNPFKVREGHWIGARIGFVALQPGKDRGWLDIHDFKIE